MGNSERLQNELLYVMTMENGLQETPLPAMYTTRTESGDMRRGGRSGVERSLCGIK